MKKLSFISAIMLLTASYSIAQTSAISNIQVSQRTDETWLVDVYFDLVGQGNAYYMNMEVSFNGGVNYFHIPGNFLTGDVGPINPGNNKHIIWDGMSNFPNRYSNQTKLMIAATTAGGINSCPGSPTVTDVDGNVYNTELIGSQCWMKENLRTTKYNNNVPIFSGYFWYDNDLTWKYIYGALYTWDVATHANGLCPQGWHLPSDAELSQLTDFMGGGLTYGGRQLKSCRQIFSPMGGNCDTDFHPRWDYNDTYYGTDDFGFSTLPAGYRNADNNFFDHLGNVACFWTSTEYDPSDVRLWIIYNNGDQITRDGAPKTWSFSVRCIKD